MVTSSATVSPALLALAASWKAASQAGNKSAKTLRIYLGALDTLSGYLIGQGMPCQVENVRREHLEAFLVARLERVKPSTASIEYRALQQFWKWAFEEDEIRVSPMAKMRGPIIPEEAPAILTDEQIRAMLRTCEGKDFSSRRGLAILRMLLDTGMRRAEIAGLNLADVDLLFGTATVLGKFRRPRVVPFGRRTPQSLDRYLRVRAAHPRRSKRTDGSAGMARGIVIGRPGYQARTESLAEALDCFLLRPYLGRVGVDGLSECTRGSPAPIDALLLGTVDLLDCARVRRT